MWWRYAHIPEKESPLVVSGDLYGLTIEAAGSSETFVCGATCQKYECSRRPFEGTLEDISCNNQRWSLLELGTEKLEQQGRVKTYGSALRLIGCLDDRGTAVRFPACARDLSLDRLWALPPLYAVGT